MIKNISFVFQKIWQKHRGLLCYLILCVLSSLGISVVSVWFPAFVVSRISTGKADAAQLAAAGLVAVCVYGLQQMASSGRGMRQLFLCRDFLYEIFLKRFDKACAYAESTEGQKAYGMARQTALWGSDFRIFLEGILDLCVCIGSFVLFGGAIFGLQPGLFSCCFCYPQQDMLSVIKMKKRTRDFWRSRLGKTDAFSILSGLRRMKNTVKICACISCQRLFPGK